MKHEYHVVYLFKTGHGSINIQTEESVMTRDGMLGLKKYIDDQNPEHGGVVIANVIPLNLE